MRRNGVKGIPLSLSIIASLALTAALVVGVFAAPVGAVNVVHSAVVSPDPVEWTPNIQDGQVNIILQLGSKVVVGGTFTTVRRYSNSIWLTRNYLFAFDMFTGVIDPNFVPQLSGEVDALAPGPDGQSVFVGGQFDSVNGSTASRNLVLLDLTNGQTVPTFKANTNGLVMDLRSRGGKLYASGRFTSIRSTPRSGLARVDPITGAVDPSLDIPFTNPQLNGPLILRDIDLTPDGSKLVAVGNFSRVGGIPRNQIAMLDLTTTPVSVSSWQTDMAPFVDPANPTSTWCSTSFATWLHGVDISPDGSYFVLVSTGAYRAGRLCDTASRWELSATGPGQRPTWMDWTGGDTLWSVSITGTAIYVGGHQRWMNNSYRGDAAGPGAVSRPGIAALDPVNGLPFSWNPTRDRGAGVFSLPATPDGLWAGDDTDILANEWHQKIGLFPLLGGTTIPPNVPYSLPNDLYNMDTVSGSLVRRSYDQSTFGASSVVPTGVAWDNARGAFALNGKLYTGWSDGTFVVRSFDGTSVGPATTIGLNGLDVQPPSGFNIPGTTTRIPSLTTDLANMTGMFFDNGRIYYTVSRPGSSGTNIANNNKLYYRYFTPESQIVGADLFVASSFPGDNVQWGSVRGMTLASGKLYFGTSDGRLWRVDWAGTGPSGTPVQIAGPGIDATNWASRGIFAFAQTVDTLAPTTPGTPVGVSDSFDSIDLTWDASTDTGSPLTYRIYRDGSSTPIGQVSSDSTTTVGYTDTGLIAGSSHTYRVDAVDPSNNASPLSAVSDPIVVLAPDGVAPTDPGIPVGTSNSTTSIGLSWSGSTDDVSQQLTYRVFRDDPSNQVGSVTTNLSSVGFTDTDLEPGSTHTYWVDAMDEANNVSGKSESAPIQVQAALFADDFSSGDFSRWTGAIRLALDTTVGSPNAPSAIGNPLAQSAYAFRDLGATYGSACLSARVRIDSLSGTVDLLRLRTAANGPITKVYADVNRKLIVRSELSGAQFISTSVLPAGWNTVELCGTVGSATSWDVYLNGVRVVNAWTADTGSTPIGRIQIGDTAAKTWTVHFDRVILDGAPG